MFEKACDPQDYLTICENLTYYEAQGNKQAIDLFSRLKLEMERSCNMNPIIRSLNGAYTKYFNKSPKFTMQGFTVYKIIDNPDGTRSLSLPDPPKPKPKIPDPIPECLIALASIERGVKEDREKLDYPETCTDQCPHVQCPYRRLENFGKKCLQHSEQYRVKSKPISDPLGRIPDLRWVNPEMRKSLRH